MRQIDEIRHAHLHAKRHFVFADVSRNIAAFVIARRDLIEILDRLNHVALPGPGHAVRCQVEDGIALRAEFDALVLRRQETVVPYLPRQRMREELTQRQQQNKARQVVAFAAEAVPEPRTHARMAGLHRPGTHERVCGIMNESVGLHRADDAQVVGHLGQTWKHRGDGLPGMAASAEGRLGRDTEMGRAVQGRERLPMRDGVGDRLAVKLGEFRLRIEGFQMRRTARHVKVDDVLGPRRVMQGIHHSLAALRRRCCRCVAAQIACEQCLQGEGAEAGRGPAEEGTACRREIVGKRHAVLLICG